MPAYNTASALSAQGSHWEVLCATWLYLACLRYNSLFGNSKQKDEFVFLIDLETGPRCNQERPGAAQIYSQKYWRLNPMATTQRKADVGRKTFSNYPCYYGYKCLQKELWVSLLFHSTRFTYVYTLKPTPS